MNAVASYATEGPVAIISLNRPERHNAINQAMSRELLRLVNEASSDASVRCLVLRGEGPSFSSGIDTEEMGQRPTGEGHLQFIRHSQSLSLAIQGCAKPVIAAVQGHALGKGFELALAADMRIAADDARFGLPEVRFGLTCDNGGSARLTTVIGPARAKFLMMSGEAIDAETAVRWGVADWTTSTSDLDGRAIELASQLARHPPLAVAAAKDLVDQVSRGAVLNGCRAEMYAQACLMETEDFREARAARRDNRPPIYHGR